jgi:hypothetical protein
MILLLLSCGEECPAGSSLAADGLCYLDEADTGAGGETIADIGPEPTLTAEEVGADIATLAGRDLPDPVALRALYLGLLHAGDAGCPGEDVDDIADGSIPLEGCTSTTGYTYRGLSEYDEGEAGGWWFGLTLGDLYITEPDGDLLAVTGTFSYDGDDGWLGEGGSVALWLEGAATASGRGVALQGGVGGPQTGSGLFFRDLYFGDITGPGGQTACGAHPSGGVSVRGNDGRWYDLDLTDCGGCGTVSFEGSALGDACADLTALGAALLERVDPL